MFIKWTTDIGGVKEMRNWKQPRMKVFGAGEAKSRSLSNLIKRIRCRRSSCHFFQSPLIQLFPHKTKKKEKKEKLGNDPKSFFSQKNFESLG